MQAILTLALIVLFNSTDNTAQANDLEILTHSAATHTPHTLADTNTKKVSPRIVGGQQARQTYPFMVSIQETLGTSSIKHHICGGTIVAARWVLTAAHCVLHTLPDATHKLSVLTGTHNLQETNSPAQYIDVEAVYIHPDYSTKKVSDLALLKLKNNTSLSPIQLISPDLAADTFNPFFNFAQTNKARVIGWGALQEGGSSSITNLQEVEVPIQSQFLCQIHYPTRADVKQNLAFCAGYPEGGQDACQGDSGGPIFAELNGTFIQLGIVSFGRGCAQANALGGYSHIAAHNDWISMYLKGFFFDKPNIDLGVVIPNTQAKASSALFNNSTQLSLISNFTFSTLLQNHQTSSQGFSLVNNRCTGFFLAQGAFCTFDVNFTANQAGHYTATLQTQQSSVVTKTTLTAEIPQMIEADADLDIDTLDWYSGGNQMWSSALDTQRPSGSVLQSGNIQHNQYTYIATYLPQAGTLRFHYKLSTEANYDFFSVILNNTTLDRFSGNSTIWRSYRLTVPAGGHTLVLKYSKDNVDEIATDSLVKIDNVRYERANPNPNDNNINNLIPEIDVPGPNLNLNLNNPFVNGPLFSATEEEPATPINNGNNNNIKENNSTLNNPFFDSIVDSVLQFLEQIVQMLIEPFQTSLAGLF